jgi:hypothetical protein
MLGSGATDLHRTGTLGLAKVNAIDDASQYLLLTKPLKLHARARGRLSTTFDLTSFLQSDQAAAVGHFASD